MATIDPEQERQRLSETYAHQSDEELEKTSAEQSELTEIAREVLRAELTKRGLYEGQMEEPVDSNPAEFRDLVEIRRFWNLLEGELAKGLLEAAGIEAFLFDGNMLRMDWFNANAIGGVKLRVDARNVEEANRILEENAPLEADTEETDSAEENP
jgi:hypothetical protein